MKFLSLKLFSFVLVAVQFICLIYLFSSGPLIALPVFLLLLEIAAFVLGIWSILVMRNSRLNIFPDVLNNSALMKKGPYSLIRHPMYMALILLSISLVLTELTTFRLIAAIVLIINLLFKIEYEERLLKKHFKNYRKYSDESWKLLPYIY